jgi:hypothetical protein
VKYLCLAYEEEQTLNALTRGEWEALREETLAYVISLRERGHLVSTYALRSPSSASTVKIREGRLSITDGPFAETKEQIGGYFLIEADDFDEALRIAAAWPSARLGTIEVRPIEEDLPMERRYL